MMKREPRWMFVAYSTVLGLLVGTAAWVGGERLFAVLAVAVLVVFGLVASVTPFGTLKASSQDEREQAIGAEAALISYGVLIVAIIVAWLVELARGNSGAPYFWLAAIGGATYGGALFVVNARR